MEINTRGVIVYVIITYPEEMQLEIERDEIGNEI